MDGERIRYTIGETIRQARKAKKMTQDDLGALMGVKKGTISSWEVGRSTPDSDDLAALSRVLEVPVDEFYTGRNRRRDVVYTYDAETDPDPDADLQAIISTYRAVNDEGKKYLRDAAAFALGREMFRS